MKTQTLYRPVGIKELQLISESGFTKFPPRLEWQPIFYPVLNQAYAEQIAREWNTNDEFSGYCGIVTVFHVDREYLKKFEVQVVGGKMHEELWVPAEELKEFNSKMVGKIEIVKIFTGTGFVLPENIVLQEIFKKLSDE